MSTTAEESRVSELVRGSTQQLWNLLQGRVVLLSEDVVSEELRDNLDRIVAGLTYYAAYEEEEDTPVVFPTAPSFFRSVLSEDKDNEKKGADGTSQESKRKGQSDVSSYDLVRKAVAQKLNISLNVATELLVGYMMYEYKGSSTSYDEIADSQMTFNVFLKDLTAYYKKERFCLLLCTQAILSDMGDEDYRFFSIIESFRSMITYKKWCWGLLRSFALAQDELETVEILHCLLILMYKIPNETIPEFFTYFSKSGFDGLRKTERMKMAEGAAMYAALIVSGITDCCNGVFPQDFGIIIKDFLSKMFDELLLNPYNIAPVFASYEIFCKESSEITSKMKSLMVNPSITFSAMLRLSEHYGRQSLYDRHSLSVVISSSIFEAFESLLAGYDTNHFGTNRQAFLIFSNILQHNLVAENFLCGTPLALTALYTDATTLFPIDIPSTLHLWKSLCMSVRSVELCNTIVKGVAKMNAVAEMVSEDNSMHIKRVGTYKVANTKSRPIYGYMLEAGLTGTLTNYEEETVVVWELPSSINMSAFEVLRAITQPIADQLQELKADNALPEIFAGFDYSAKDLHATAGFIIQFWKSTDEQVPELTNLVYPACSIMEIMLKYKTDVSEKVRLVQDLLGIVTAVNEFCAEVSLFSYIYDAIPGGDHVSVVEDLVLGRESVSSTKCEVTLAFLNMINSFAEHDKCWKQGATSVFQGKFLRCIGFVAENILPSCANWRVESEGIRLEVFLKCLQIFIRIFLLKDPEWTDLKKECLRFLVAPSSCLIEALKTEEANLEESIIKPKEGNKILTTVMCTALRLLLRLIRFESRLFKHINEMLDGMLIRILGRLFRHRLIPAIPTLTMKIFKEVAEHSNLSLLACFGNDEAAFRDVIIQRLEFTSEDINLKIAVLDFLTIISQTQVGIIECFFADGVLENSVIDLMQENDDLAVSSLRFFRSLFRQSLPLPKSRDDFWCHIMTPINNLKRGCRLEIITATLHILTFELYLNGTSELNFNKELESFLKGNQLHFVIEVAVSSLSGEATKCLTSVKHFFTLVLGRPELKRLISKDMLVSLQGLMLESFWKARPKEDSLLSATLAELTTILTTTDSANSAFISELLNKLIETFSEHTLATQLALLCLLNKCYTHCEAALQGTEIENTLRILKRLFDVSIHYLEEKEESQRVNSVLNVACSILTTIMSKQHIDAWGNIMKKELIPSSLILISSVGITKKKSPNVVANCLAVLVTLAEHTFGCLLVPINGISKSLYSHLYKFTDDIYDEAWTNVFLLCLNLNSKLLWNLKHVYLDEALAFWGQYSGFLNHKLSLMADLTEICVGIDDTEKGYNDMKAIIQSSAFVLNDIHTLMPYLENWQALQPSEVFKAIRGVFYIIQEICGLLQQPYLLQSSVGQKPKQSCSPESKLSPKHLEMQSKLWDICDVSLQILVELKSKDEEFIEKATLIPTIFQVGQLSIKALTKAERKPQPGFNVTSRLSSILEKVMVIIYYYAIPILEDPNQDPKFQVNFRRELCTEVTSLCDGIRRLNIPKNEFLLTLCTKLETKFNQVSEAAMLALRRQQMYDANLRNLRERYNFWNQLYNHMSSKLGQHNLRDGIARRNLQLSSKEVE